jgi:uncharacterized membrane protein
MIIAVTIAVGLLISILSSSKWKYLFISLLVFGLLISHYTTAYMYLFMIVGLSFVIIVKYVMSREKTNYTIGIVVALILLIIGIRIYYGDSRGSEGIVGSVSRYSGNVINNIEQEVRTNSIVNIPIVWTVNTDILLARILLMVRVVIVLCVWFILWKQNKAWSVVGILYGGVACVALLSVSLRSIEVALGSLRPSFIVLPIELLGIAYWWDNRGNDWKLYPLLAIGSVVYH